MNPSKQNIHTLHFQVVFPFFDPPKEHTSIIIILRHVKASSAANSGVLDNVCVCDVHIRVSGCVQYVGVVGGGPHLMGLSRCSSFDNKLSLTLNYLSRRQRSHEKWQRHGENCNDVSNVGGVAQIEVQLAEWVGDGGGTKYDYAGVQQRQSA